MPGSSSWVPAEVYREPAPVVCAIDMSSKHKPAPHHQDVLFSGYLAIGCGKVLVVSTWPHLYSTELGEIQTEKISPPHFQQKTGTRTVTQDIGFELWLRVDLNHQACLRNAMHLHAAEAHVSKITGWYTANAYHANGPLNFPRRGSRYGPHPGTRVPRSRGHNAMISMGDGGSAGTRTRNQGIHCLSVCKRTWLCGSARSESSASMA